MSAVPLTTGADDWEAILGRLLDLHPKKIDLSLGRITRLLEALGRPELRLPPVIHVAGTNGKGSTVAFMRAILEAAGRSVHVYTSPHLVRFHERIRLGQKGGGKLVGDAELAATLAFCEKVNSWPADHLLRNHHGGGAKALQRASGRLFALGGWSRRQGRCDQCRRASRRDGHHARLL